MKTAFLFSGQGAQCPGMGKDFYEKFDSAKRVFSKANEVLGRDLARLCFDGNQEELNLTRNTQVCTLAADLAAGCALKEMGVEPDCVAGFSLGEYAALVYAGVLELGDAFRIVQVRADSMQEAVPVGQGAMAALMGVDGAKAKEICERVSGGYVRPANYNSPLQTVISGDSESVDCAIDIAAQMGFTAMRLAVSAPFHCKLMEPAARRVGKELEKVEVHDPRIPVYMNVNGRAVTNASSIKELLIKQAMSPVYWIDTLINMKADGVGKFIECGVGKTLWGLTRKNLKEVHAFKAVDMKSLQDTLAKME